MAADVADLNPDFGERLNAMIEAAHAAGVELGVNSGYRSVAEQTQLWNNHPDPRYVAYPGTSMHNKGLAADLSGDLGWAHAHAAEFGLYWPMSWEPWHIQPVGLDGKSGGTAPGTMTAANTTAPTNDMAHGLDVIAQTLQERPGGAPTVTDPMAAQTTQTQTPPLPTRQGQQGAGAVTGGDLNAQLKAGFERAGRSDLAAIVGTSAWNTWINAESGGDPTSVGPANRYSMNGHGPGGLFQFLGHDWAEPYYQGGKFTMSPEEQAYNAATKFNLTPQRIEGFAAQVQSGNYVGWG